MEWFQDQIFSVVARYGYAENKIRLAQTIELATRGQMGLPAIPSDQITYFMEREVVRVSKKAHLLKKLPLLLYTTIKKVRRNANAID
jgi:hypothetical protein